ncbi:MAG: division/cell wall cluster transcriptional repressor MraZ [Candidatus Dojkabacteria bacterium]|nr:MAG: division/cell wall cluster transcriptional repressor MraZ [Candidatus Dojkabacteria bacterium]
MLIGEYRSKIGDKKRVAIPKRFRDEMGDDLILTRGYEKALVLVNKEMWGKVAGEVIGGSFINKNIRDSSRFLVGSAVELDLDQQGRVVIPTALYEHAALSKEVVFVGLVNWVELWDKEMWKERLNYLQAHSEIIADELSKIKSDDK